MKNKKFGLMLVAIFTILLMPVLANAQEKVIVYFFRGEGCSHCAETEEFFETLEADEEFKNKFEIKDYEVWHNSDNQKLAEKVAKAMGDDLGGVPYIIIGKKTWNGFTEAYGKEIKQQITELYDLQDYEDPVKDIIEGKKADSSVTVVIIVLVIIAIGVGLHFARRDVEEIPVEEDSKEEKETVEVEAEEKETETYKPAPKKKSSNQSKKKNTHKKR